MATKKARRKTTATRTNAAPRRRMNAAPHRRATKRRARRMNAAKGDIQGAGMSILAVSAGAIVGAVAINMAGKIAPSLMMRQGGAAVLGLLGAAFAPALRDVAIGVGVAGVVPMASSLLQGAGIPVTGAMNAARMDPAKYKAIAEQVRRAGERMRGSTPETLTGYQPQTLVGAYAFDGNIVG